MKTIVYAASLFLSVLLVSCSREQSDQSHENHEHSELSEVKYACPMKCEGEKTYAEKGECPVCHMELEEVE